MLGTGCAGESEGVLRTGGCDGVIAGDCERVMACWGGDGELGRVRVCWGG